MIGIHGFKGKLCAMKNPSIVLMTLRVAVCIPLGTLLPRGGTALRERQVTAAELAKIVVVYLCAFMDQRMHDGGGVEARFGVPLWTTLKDTSPSGRQDNESHASLYRIYALLSRERIARHGLTLGLTSTRPGEGVSFVAAHLASLSSEQTGIADYAAHFRAVLKQVGCGVQGNSALPSCLGWSVRAQVQAHFDWRTAAHLVEACHGAQPRHNTQAVPA